MTRPKLVPNHKHDWQPNLVGTLATCRICTLSMPIAVVHLDQPQAGDLVGHGRVDWPEWPAEDQPSIGRPLNPPEPKET